MVNPVEHPGKQQQVRPGVLSNILEIGRYHLIEKLVLVLRL